MSPVPHLRPTSISCKAFYGTMRAARYYGKEDIRVENIPEPSVGAGQIKVSALLSKRHGRLFGLQLNLLQIRPAFVGICGTDLHEYLGGPNFCPTTPHPVTHETIPVTLGHEFSGVIQEIGPGVTGFTLGQPCAVQPTIFCGSCAACDAHSENVCHSGGFVGLSGGGGGLSDAVCVSATHVFPLPSKLPLEIGALVEPLAVAWHAVSAASELSPESVVVVIGGGPIGLATILCLKAKGVQKIIVSEVATSRQLFGKQMGASQVVNPIRENLKGVALELSDGRGADVVFDCAGVPAR
jgi:threonine dehydrogenase-like Zn-dependent dehydrogenase